VTLPAKTPSAKEPAASMTEVEPITGPALVIELQHELTRVECYDGPANGAWTAQTRKAMAAFVERANAMLPIDKADPVLLALVKHHTGRACGRCPAGQEASFEGRCLPKAIAARATVLQPVPSPQIAGRKPHVANAGVPQPSRRAHRRLPIEGRMGVGAPIIGPRPSDREPKVAAAQPSPLSSPPLAQSRREKRAARHANRRIASQSPGYLRPMRSSRYSYRPFGRPRGNRCASVRVVLRPP